MGIWNKEVVKANGDYLLIIENQDDYTGRITLGVRKLKYKGGEWCCLNMGNRINCTKEVESFKAREEEIKKALAWYRETRF